MVVALAVILAIVFGLGVGLLLGFAIFGGEGSEADSRAAVNVAAGCAVVERLSEEGPIDPEQASIDDPFIWEAGGAGQLFVAASYADDDYEQWAERGQALVASMQRLQIDLANDTIEDLAADCADL